MARLTKSQVEQMVDELIHLQPLVERYKSLEKEVKAGLRQFKSQEVVAKQGRAFISISERISISPETARTVLDSELASKIIEIRESVPDKRVQALVDTEIISQEQYDKLLEQAKRTPVVSLYVRPLK